MQNKIAIIGMSGRFPGAQNIDLFWKNLCEGKESIATLSEEDLLRNGEPQNKSYIRKRGTLKNIEEFDADFFSIPHAEAELMDPQHRFFLECCWEGLENAGYDPDRFAGKIGVFAGVSRSTYFLNHLYSNSNISPSAKEYLCRVGNENDFLATRVSYKLNLKGPSLSIQTACSSSLASVCTACTYLLSHQCDIALAGGASIFCPQESGYMYQKEMIFSSDGHCRPFDAKANGTVPGNGVGVVVLKRLEHAIADRDHIYAIITGYGINNDGREKMGFSAPSVQGQADAIASAIRMSDINPKTIGYIEAHGTGTSIGDPIEIKGLSKAFGMFDPCENKKCRIGSVKGNIGHLMEASGIAGLIKAAMILKYQKIPPTLHFTKPNPHIDFDSSPFYVNSELEEWKENDWPRRAGVSSFGFGGTNAHLILEESPSIPSQQKNDSLQILPLSAKTPQALEESILQLGHFLQHHPTIPLPYIAYTLQFGRKQWKYRKAFVCKDTKHAAQLLLGSSPSSLKEDSDLYLLAQSWASGASMNWETIHPISDAHRVPLPTYPFERKRCWIELPSEHIKETKSIVNQEMDKDSAESIERKLASIWKHLLGCEKIDREDDFFDLGGESILALQMLTQIEKEIGAVLSLQSFYEAPTILQLARMISLKANPPSPRMVCLKKGTEEMSMFMIHPIEGTLFCYAQLARKIHFKGSIWGIQTSETHEQDQTIEQIASAYIYDIKKVQKSGPYFLFGASFGGIVAYEVAQQLKKSGDSIALLAMLDSLNPTHPSVRKETFKEMQVSLIELFEGKNTLLSELSEEELSNRIGSLMGFDSLPKQQRDKMLVHINQHLSALQKYKPQPYDGKITFFEMKERLPPFENIPFWASWVDCGKQDLNVIHLEGNHLNMLQNPYNENLAKILSSEKL